MIDCETTLWIREEDVEEGDFEIKVHPKTKNRGKEFCVIYLGKSRIFLEDRQSVRNFLNELQKMLEKPEIVKG